MQIEKIKTFYTREKTVSKKIVNLLHLKKKEMKRKIVENPFEAAECVAKRIRALPLSEPTNIDIVDAYEAAKKRYERKCSVLCLTLKEGLDWSVAKNFLPGIVERQEPAGTRAYPRFVWWYNFIGVEPEDTDEVKLTRKMTKLLRELIALDTAIFEANVEKIKSQTEKNFISIEIEYKEMPIHRRVTSMMQQKGYDLTRWGNRLEFKVNMNK